MNLNNRPKGFTLIEIIIALSIFAIVALLTASTMYYAFNTRERIINHIDRMVHLQLAISLMERSLMQAIPRAIRSHDMQLIDAFIGQPDYTEFTQNGFPNPSAQEKRSTLKRVAFLCNHHQLQLRQWRALDAVDRKQYQEKILLGNLLRCHFNYLDKHLQVLANWHQSTASLHPLEPLPKAVQLSLTFENHDRFDFLFPIPGAIYD